MINRIKVLGAKIYDEIKKKVFKVKGVRYDHQKTLNEMLRVIGSCNMNTELKMILRMRIWGKDAQVFCPLAYEEIAVLLNCKVNDVKRWEEDAIYNVQQYLSKVGLVEAVEKFHKDKHFKDILNPEKRIIV